MFEKVLAGDRRRTQQRNRRALIGSVLAHALVALGAAQVPIGPRAGPGGAHEELVGFVELPAAAPDAIRQPAPPRPPAGPAALRAEPAGRSPLPSPEPAQAASEAPERLPQLEVGMPAPLPVAGSVVLRAVSFAPVGAETPAAGAVVEANALAERPRLANRYEMEQVWKRLYPPRLELRGITGETLIAFVIDEEGRVIPESIEVVEASREEFAQAVLLGVARLRFRPMRIGGIPVKVRTTLPVLWRLPSA